MIDDKLYRPVADQEIPLSKDDKVNCMFLKLKDFLGRGLSQMQMLEETSKLLLETVFDLHEISEQELLDVAVAFVVEFTDLIGMGAES